MPRVGPQLRAGGDTESGFGFRSTRLKRNAGRCGVAGPSRRDLRLSSRPVLEYIRLLRREEAREPNLAPSRVVALVTGLLSETERSFASRGLNYERLPVLHGLHVLERNVDAHQFVEKPTALVHHAGRQAHRSILVVLV